MVRIGKPGSGGASSGLKLGEHMAHVLAFAGNEERNDVHTANGVVDRVAFSEYAVCITCGAVYRNHMTFGKALVPAILDAEEPVVVGVIGKGEATAGKNAAWLLFDPSDEELTAADEWFNKYSAELPSGRIVIEQPPPAGADEAF